MPRDSQLLPPTSRALLRAARAGCIYIRQGIRAADDEEKSVADPEDPAAAANVADRSFTTRKWMALPKHLEPAEVEYLAKRRPGLPSLYGATAGTDGSSAASGPMRRTKFKKVDPDTGNISIYEAWVPEGHRIEGEITGDVQTIAEQSEVPVKPEAPAPGTIVEGVGVVNAEGVVVAEAGSAAVMTPPKRRPPPPKRKGKGIGKGRKKKVMFAPGEGADAATVHGVGSGSGNNEADLKGHSQQDASQMSIDQSGQEEDDEDGDEADESDEGDESMIDAKTPDTPQPPPGTESLDQPSSETPAGQSVDVDFDMTDAVAELQPPAPEPPFSGGKDVPSQQQPTHNDTIQPERSPGTDINVSISEAPEEDSDARDLDDKAMISEHDETYTLPSQKNAIPNDSAEIAAEVGEVPGSDTKPQGEDTATEPTAELVPKEESDDQQDTSIVPPPETFEQPSEAPGAQNLGQLQTPEQPSGEVAKSELISVLDPAVAETRDSQSLSDEPTTRSADIQEEPPAAVQNDSLNPLDVPEVNVDSDEAKSMEPREALPLEPNTMPGPNPPADSNSLLAPSAAADDPQTEPAPMAEQSTVSDPTATDAALSEVPTSVSDEKTTATIDAGVPGQSPVSAGLEQKEDVISEESEAPLDQLPDSTPKSGPTEST
jgi:hypothetical protein